MWSLVLLLLLLAVCTLCWMVLFFCCYYYNNINLHSDMNAWDTLVCTSGHSKAAWHFRNISRPVSQQHQFRKSDDGVVSRIFSARVVSCCVGGGHRRDTYLLKIVCMFNVAASIIRTTSQPLGILRASKRAVEHTPTPPINEFRMYFSGFLYRDSDICFHNHVLGKSLYHKDSEGWSVCGPPTHPVCLCTHIVPPLIVLRSVCGFHE